MSSDFLLPLALAFGVVGAIVLLAGFAALMRGRAVSTLLRLLSALLLIAVGTAFALLGFGIQGYRALTHEETAARIEVQPTGPQRFRATFVFPDDRRVSFDLAGDEIYVDAHILKWKPWANVLGLHTAYELSRVAGRYTSIDAERSAPRTVYSLQPERPVDLFALRTRYGRLAAIVDAEYGSATFVPAGEPKVIELRVSATGLLFRSPAS